MNDQQRYLDAAHAMQSGVAAEIGVKGDNAAAADHKHLRTGVNAAMVEFSALIKLLIAKGILTEEEWWGCLADGMEEEKMRYERRLGVMLK